MSQSLLIVEDEASIREPLVSYFDLMFKIHFLSMPIAIIVAGGLFGIGTLLRHTK